MLFQWCANATLVLHLAFIVFALLGGMLAIRWRWLPLFHLPAAAWGFFVELTGRVCPLTYIENYFRLQAGEAGYRESFLEHYLLSLLYPAGLTPEMQYSLAAVVVVVNVAIYGGLLYRHWRRGGTRSL